MQNHQNHNQTSKLYFDLHHTKDKLTGYSLSICIKNNNDDDDDDDFYRGNPTSHGSFKWVPH